MQDVTKTQWGADSCYKEANWASEFQRYTVREMDMVAMFLYGPGLPFATEPTEPAGPAETYMDIKGPSYLWR